MPAVIHPLEADRHDDGMAERGPAIIEFKNGSMNVVDPAPRSFVR